MKRYSLLLAISLILILAAGCTVITYDVTGMQELISMTRLGGDDYEVVGHFKWSTRGVFLVSLITVMNPDLEKHLATELNRYNGNAIMNVHILEETGVIDILITWIQSYLIGAAVISTRHVVVEGDIVKMAGMSSIDYEGVENQLAAAAKAYLHAGVTTSP